nr:hypothetical protein [Tanacetum cinerariifolium]
MTNSTINSILKNEKLYGPNFLVWYRNLRIVFKVERNLVHLEQALPEASVSTIVVDDYNAYDMIKELKTMFQQQAHKELFEIVKAFHACKQEEWQCSTCKVFGHVLDDCPKRIISDVLKNLKNPKQAARGVQAGPKQGFKPTKQVYQLVSKKNGANTSRGNSKSSKALGSPTTTPLTEKIHNLERQVLDGKYVLVDDDGH